jgi:hypothetical protein
MDLHQLLPLPKVNSVNLVNLVNLVNVGGGAGLRRLEAFLPAFTYFGRGIEVARRRPAETRATRCLWPAARLKRKFSRAGQYLVIERSGGTRMVLPWRATPKLRSQVIRDNSGDSIYHGL